MELGKDYTIVSLSPKHLKETVVLKIIDNVNPPIFQKSYTRSVSSKRKTIQSLDCSEPVFQIPNSQVKSLFYLSFRKVIKRFVYCETINEDPKITGIDWTSYYTYIFYVGQSSFDPPKYRSLKLSWCVAFNKKRLLGDLPDLHYGRYVQNVENLRILKNPSSGQFVIVYQETDQDFKEDLIQIDSIQPGQVYQPFQHPYLDPICKIVTNFKIPFSYTKEGDQERIHVSAFLLQSWANLYEFHVRNNNQFDESLKTLFALMLQHMKSIHEMNKRKNDYVILGLHRERFDRVYSLQGNADLLNFTSDCFKFSLKAQTEQCPVTLVQQSSVTRYNRADNFDQYMPNVHSPLRYKAKDIKPLSHLSFDVVTQIYPYVETIYEDKPNNRGIKSTCRYRYDIFPFVGAQLAVTCVWTVSLQRPRFSNQMKKYHSQRKNQISLKKNPDTGVIHAVFYDSERNIFNRSVNFNCSAECIFRYCYCFCHPLIFEHIYKYSFDQMAIPFSKKEMLPRTLLFLTTTNNWKFFQDHVLKTSTSVSPELLNHFELSMQLLGRLDQLHTEGRCSRPCPCNKCLRQRESVDE